MSVFTPAVTFFSVKPFTQFPFLSFKKLTMNTFAKSYSIALAVALGFSMLVTSTSVNAQSSDKEMSEKVQNVSSDNTKPTVTFRESVKKKVAENNDAKAGVAIQPAATKTESVPAAKVTKVPAKTESQSWNKVQSKGNRTATEHPYNREISTTNKGAKTNVVENTAVKTKPVPSTTVKYENASPAGKAKLQTHAKPSGSIQILHPEDESITHDSKGSLIRENQNDSKK